VPPLRARRWSPPGGTRVAIGGRQGILGIGQAIGGGPAAASATSISPIKAAAFLREGLRGVCEAVSLGLGLLHAPFERRDLRSGAVPALGPTCAFAADRMQPALRQLGLAGEGLDLRAQLGEPGAPLLDIGAHASEPALHLGRGRQALEHALGFASGCCRLVKTGRQPGFGFRQRRHSGGIAPDLAFAGGVQLTRGRRRALQLAPARPAAASASAAAVTSASAALAAARLTSTSSRKS